MPRKGYVAKTSRPKFPLTVDQEKKLVAVAKVKGSGTAETLLLIMLSTGMHPKVLADPKYSFTYTNEYYAWKRPKTNREIRGGWSKAMRELDDLDGRLKKLKGCSRQYYHQVLKLLGQEGGIKGFCPLQARHTNLVNRARLGHNPFDIAMSTSTDLQTIYQYYMIGAGESKALGEADKTWLQWLVES